MRGIRCERMAPLFIHLLTPLTQGQGAPQDGAAYETEHLGRDSWALCSDLERHSLFPCTPVRARGFWRDE